MKELAYQHLSLKTNTVWRLQYLLALMKKHNQKKVLVARKNINNEKPLVYSCSGCSSAAQMANYIAL
jgi:3-mercaptopyruvate sulfurtransferase SseA